MIFFKNIRKTQISHPAILFFLEDDRLAAAVTLIEKHGSSEDKANLTRFFEQGIKAFDPTADLYEGPMF
jgi:hypothetical protein